MSTIDQDDFALEPLVWHGAGVVVGTEVMVVVRRFDEVYKWFVRAVDPGGLFSAQTGIAMTLNDAAEDANLSVQEMLLVRDEDKEAG